MSRSWRTVRLDEVRSPLIRAHLAGGGLEIRQSVNEQPLTSSPGFLTNTIKSRADFDEGDNRLNHPRFSDENFGENLKLVQTLADIAEKKGCSPGQLAIAWVLAQGYVSLRSSGGIETLTDVIL